METISVSKLKAHLSAELKKVQAGTRLLVVDHRHPVAELVPTQKEALFLHEPEIPYGYQALSPLIHRDPLNDLDEERSDRW